MKKKIILTYYYYYDAYVYLYIRIDTGKKFDNNVIKIGAIIN